MLDKAIVGLRRVAEQRGAVGLSAAATSGGKLIFEGALGFRDKEHALPATPNTIYRLASVTKHLSAITLMTLVDEGKAELDADISDYLGYNVRNPRWPDVPVTLRQLMTHTSTLSEFGSYNKILAGDMPSLKLSEILLPGSPGDDPANWLPDQPGTKYEYSSFGSGVVGTVAERITGIRFAELVKQRLFAPLGLCDATLDTDALNGLEVAVPDASGSIGDADWLKKSLENKKRLCALPVGEAYRSAQGNGYMRAHDLLAVTQLFLNGGISNGVRILSQNAADEMCKVHFSDSLITTGLNLMHYNHLAPKPLIGHYGRAFGAQTIFMFDPHTKNAATVLCNGADMTSDGRGIIGNTLFCTQAMQALWAACFS